jgi:hypothetical protein
MKNTQTILSHLSNFPQFKNLKQQNCYSKYIKLLSQKYQNAIAFVYIRHKVLHIALKHPGFKMELQYNKTTLLEIAHTFASLSEACQHFHVEDLVIFHSKYYPLKSQKMERTTIPHYTELATANFTIESTDEDIIKKFEAIKRTITCNN